MIWLRQTNRGRDEHAEVWSEICGPQKGFVLLEGSTSHNKSMGVLLPVGLESTENKYKRHGGWPIVSLLACYFHFGLSRISFFIIREVILIFKYFLFRISLLNTLKSCWYLNLFGTKKEFWRKNSDRINKSFGYISWLGNVLFCTSYSSII